MGIKNKLKQIREESMAQHFYTDSIRHYSLEYLIKAGVFLCNTPLISSSLNNFLMHRTKQTIETHDRNCNSNFSRNQSFYLFQYYSLSILFQNF